MSKDTRDISRSEVARHVAKIFAYLAQGDSGSCLPHISALRGWLTYVEVVWKRNRE